MKFPDRFYRLQVIACVGTLALGGALHVLGHGAMAGQVWLGGAALVLCSVLADTLAALWRGELGLDLVALVSIAGAVLLRESLAAAVIAAMYAGGRALEGYAERRAREEMSALLARAPRSANRYGPDGIAPVPLAAVGAGDRLLVRPGDTVPVDGTLLCAAVVDESTLTGESLPVTYAAGHAVASGCVNAGDAFDLLASGGEQDSTFAQIVRLVQAAQQSRAPAARLADRYALLFVPAALALAGLAWLLTGDPHRALAVVVVATPCPLILAVPVAIVCAMSRCAQRGVLVKHGGALEKLAQVKTLFFDKTGTLTSGKAQLIAMAAAQPEQQDEMLRLAASLEQMSSHAIAQAVVRAAVARGLTLSVPEAVSEQPGAGLSGRVDGRDLRVGGKAYVLGGTALPGWSASMGARVGYEGGAGVYVAVDGRLCGVLQMADEVRLDTPRAIRLLRACGVERIIMLTGDRRDVATTVGNSLGVDTVMAEQSPAAKLAAIAGARHGGATMMVGDGINDAPALAAADIGVAMGAQGAAAAAESAQVVLLVDRLDRLAFAVRVAQRTRAIALQSVIAGMGLSFAAMLAAAFGYLPAVAGAIVQEVIDVAVILNALRVLGIEQATGGDRLSADDIRKFQAEHARLQPIVERLVWLADRADALPADAIRDELVALSALLQQQVLPHESHDDSTLYPRMARLIGGEDPMASMSSTHREIYRLSRAVDRLSAHVPQQEHDASSALEVRRTLYALHAILRLHFAQEEEIYHGLSS